MISTYLDWFLQFIVLAFVGILGLLYLLRNTASRYFVVDSTFDSSADDYSSLDRRKMESISEAAGGAAEGFSSCPVCGLVAVNRCSGCKMVKYCSTVCQISHWKSKHRTKCKDLQSIHKANYTKPKSTLRGRKDSVTPSDGSSRRYKPSNKMAGSRITPQQRSEHLFSVEENVERFRGYTRDPKDSIGEFLEHYVTLWGKASEGGVSDIEASARLVRLLPLRWQSWATREMASIVTRDPFTYAEVGDFPRFLSIVSARWATAGEPPSPSTAEAPASPASVLPDPPSRDVGVDPASLVVGPTMTTPFTLRRCRDDYEASPSRIRTEV